MLAALCFSVNIDPCFPFNSENFQVNSAPASFVETSVSVEKPHSPIPTRAEELLADVNKTHVTQRGSQFTFGTFRHVTAPFWLCFRLQHPQ